MKTWPDWFSARSAARKRRPERMIIVTPEGEFESGTPEFSAALSKYMRPILFD